MAKESKKSKKDPEQRKADKEAKKQSKKEHKKEKRAALTSATSPCSNQKMFNNSNNSKVKANFRNPEAYNRKCKANSSL